MCVQPCQFRRTDLPGTHFQEDLSVIAYNVLKFPVECVAVRWMQSNCTLAVGGCHEVAVWQGKCLYFFLPLRVPLLDETRTVSSLKRVCSLPPPKSTLGIASKKVMATSVHWLDDRYLLATYLFHGVMYVSAIHVNPTY
jgi:hypothetical protein